MRASVVFERRIRAESNGPTERRHAMRRVKSTVFLGALCAVFPAFVSCGHSDANGGGTGGAPAGTGGFGGASYGPDSGLGGTPFMSLGGRDGGACKKTGQPCTLTGECCGGNLCQRYGAAPEWQGCQLSCAQNSECPTGCCYHFSNSNVGFCTTAKWCACGVTGSRCSTPDQPGCCDTHTCVAGDAQSTFYECRQKCTQNSDCDTQCCVPIMGIGVSACLDRMYCP
jgi:hypothetical protein